MADGTEMDEPQAYDFKAETGRAQFDCNLTTFTSTLGWGPSGPCAEEFKDMPYQPFSKSDRIGKAADITGQAYRGRSNRYQSAFGAGDAYGYFHDEDESSFSLVNSTKKPVGMFQRRKWQHRTSRRDLHQARDNRRMAGMQPLSKNQKTRERDRAREERKWQKRWAGRRRIQHRNDQREFQSSVDVKSSWEILEEIEFVRLAKLSQIVAAPKDLLTCGQLAFYDKSYDRINTRTKKNLVHTDKVFHTVTTTEDPNIRELAKGEANVFGTDAILSCIMCCQRSKYSWDIVIDKFGDKIFFDKRENSQFDYLTVDETSFEPPEDIDDGINSPSRLAFEATYINRMFSQMVLNKKGEYKFKESNPFVEDDEQVASVGYRYRQWDLGNGINLVCRTEHDAAFKDKEGRTGFMNIKTFNEWRTTPTMNWRQKLDSQRGAVLATELKNNGFKVARWTLSALLSGSSQLRLGYCSRTSQTDNSQHVVLGNQLFKPKELAAQVNLNVNNCWAVLKHIIELVRKMDDGRYLLLKDPNKAVLRLYSVPPGTFDDDEDDSDSDELGGDNDEDDDEKA